MLRIKRAYDPPARGDGQRILVERLWPRGIKKESLAADEWLKEVAPSTALRQWFGHRVERWEEFQQRYRKELDENPGGWEPLLDASRRGTVTLLYSAHDVLHNSAVVLRDYLAKRPVKRPAPSGVREQRPPSANRTKRSPATKRLRARTEHQEQAARTRHRPAPPGRTRS